MTKYFLWNAQPPRGGCVVHEVRNFDELLDLQEGPGSIADGYPDDVEIVMDPDHRKDVKLYDHLYNVHRLIVASPKLTSFLKGLKLAGVEFLPISIIDHKGKVASPEYAVVNPCNVYDCIDRDATDIDWNPIDPDLIASVSQLTFDESKIDPTVPMFRVKHMAHYVFVREDVAKAILAQDFSGPYMKPLAEVDL